MVNAGFLEIFIVTNKIKHSSNNSAGEYSSFSHGSNNKKSVFLKRFDLSAASLTARYPDM